MDLLRQGLAPFVEREVQEKVRVGAVRMDTVRRFSEDPTLASKPIAQWDAAGPFEVEVGDLERRLPLDPRRQRTQPRVGTARLAKWAHQERYSSRDAERTLDSAVRLLTAISAPEAEEIDKSMLELDA